MVSTLGRVIGRDRVQTFPQPAGPATNPFWGRGNGSFEVNYQKAATDLWSYARDPQKGDYPVAIVTITRTGTQNAWIMEPVARNLQVAPVPKPRINNAWIPPVDTWSQLLPESQYWYVTSAPLQQAIELPYGYPANSALIAAPAVTSPSNAWVVQNWIPNPPAVGGSGADPSPFRGLGPFPLESGYDTVDKIDPSIPVFDVRMSNLPMGLIVAGINNASIGISAYQRVLPVPGQANAGAGFAGSFVSEYIAYHALWYRDWTLTAPIIGPVITPIAAHQRCRMAGAVHIGINVTPQAGEEALDIMLHEIIDRL